VLYDRPVDIEPTW